MPSNGAVLRLLNPIVSFFKQPSYTYPAAKGDNAPKTFDELKCLLHKDLGSIANLPEDPVYVLRHVHGVLHVVGRKLLALEANPDEPFNSDSFGRIEFADGKRLNLYRCFEVMRTRMTRVAEVLDATLQSRWKKMQAAVFDNYEQLVTLLDKVKFNID